MSCEAATAALSFLKSLKFSQAASVAAKAECPECGKLVRLYCSNCIRSVVPTPEPLQLGLNVLILRHPKEAAGKSSATPLPLLSRDVQVEEWSPQADGSAMGPMGPMGPGTWLVFPSPDAWDACNVDWSSVTQLVLVDSRWKHARAVVEDPRLKLKDLPAMKLGPDVSLRSCFWRSATEKLADVQGLLSTAECLHCLLQLRHRFQGTGEDRLDDLLFFFSLRLELVVQEYQADPTRCCPWCTESQRRRAVHAGNERKQEELATAGHIENMKRVQECKKSLRKAHGQQRHQEMLAKIASYDANKDIMHRSPCAMPETVGERLTKAQEFEIYCDPRAHVDAALAELKRKEGDPGYPDSDPQAILELSQKADAFKKKGNERLKENTKSAAREALEFFTSGLEVRCSDPVLNAQLYSNRAHVRLLLRQFVEAVDDCRKAIERDPKNIKAYWRAARASLHLDLCRNGIDFCDAGLEHAPKDGDLQKLRATCAEKLAGQQQRRKAQASSAQRDFNADEAIAIQDKVTGLNEQLSRLKATLGSKQRQRVRLELTQQTIDSTPDDAKLYRGIGRCFLLGERQGMLDEMKSTMDSIDEEL
eukprot:symbB.v1.2.008173.t1/scaffold512.1/size193505/14